jgi:hypothetical protein
MPISTRLPLIEYQKKIRLNLFAGVDMARNLDMPELHYLDPRQASKQLLALHHQSSVALFAREEILRVEILQYTPGYYAIEQRVLFRLRALWIVDGRGRKGNYMLVQTSRSGVVERCSFRYIRSLSVRFLRLAVR